MTLWAVWLNPRYYRQAAFVLLLMSSSEMISTEALFILGLFDGSRRAE
jgi:hypothetical protein